MEDVRGFIAARVAKELKDGDVVSLGIGLPTQVENYLPEGVRITLHSETALLERVRSRLPTTRVLMLSMRADQPASVLLGGSFVDSAVSFGIIRGGHVDVTVLGLLKLTRRATYRTGSYRGKRFRAWAEQWIWW